MPNSFYKVLCNNPMLRSKTSGLCFFPSHVPIYENANQTINRIDKKFPTKNA